MNTTTLQALLNQLISTWENEVIEFKEANDNFSTDKIGRYFSALSNEANVQRVEKAYLVFGINDKTHDITGTDYRSNNPTRLQNLKQEVFEGSGFVTTFRYIHEIPTPKGRVLLFEIPPAPPGIVVRWKGVAYGRSGQSLGPLDENKSDEIRNQQRLTDWSSEIVPGATVQDLDEAAIQKARESYAEKIGRPLSEIANWPLLTFLDRASVTRDSKITRTAILLLGKSESAHFLLPHPAQMTWKLEGLERAYEHFGPPFLLSTSQLYQKIRNVQIRILPANELIAHEVSKYDQKMVLEALHNCIAHQDYTRYGRINVIERIDKLIFENEGTFFEGQPDDYVLGRIIMPRRYRNPHLVGAMAKLKMIDQSGYGIQEMYQTQVKRYFPMPDYDFSHPNAVHLTIYGEVVDLAYSRLLMQKMDLPLADILALDRVQKGLPLSSDKVKKLRQARLIEGRKPHLHVSATIAAITSNKADYIRMRAQDDTFYTKLITDYLEKFNQSSRAELNALLFQKLSEALSQEQKINKINNLITKLRRNRIIVNMGSDRFPRWRLAEKK